MNHTITVGIVGFLIGSFWMYLSVKEYRSSSKTEKQWYGKEMSLTLADTIDAGFRVSFLLFIMAFGFYSLSIYALVITLFGSAG